GLSVDTAGAERNGVGLGGCVERGNRAILRPHGSGEREESEQDGVGGQREQGKTQGHRIERMKNRFGLGRGAATRGTGDTHRTSRNAAHSAAPMDFSRSTSVHLLNLLHGSVAYNPSHTD